MTVSDYFAEEKIDLDFVQDFADENGSDYWANSIEFVSDNWANDTSDLTQKQAAWLTKILDDCVERRIKLRKKGLAEV